MRTIAITSGKGGVGKTNLSANIAIQLAQKGHRVTLFDADLGLANVDVILGVRAEWNLQNMISGERTLNQIIAKGPGGIDFIAGGSGVEALAKLSGVDLDRFLTELADLERRNDFLIFDTGAGIDHVVLTFLQAADETLLVATPDPASITDAYAIAKALWHRRPNARIEVIMNMVHDEPHAMAVFAKLRAITEQFIGQRLEYAGFVRFDAKAVDWIRKRRPFSLADPKLAASQDVRALAAHILGERVDNERQTLVDRFRSMLGFAKSA